MKARRTPDESMLQGGANNIFGNALYRNHGKGRFEEVSDRAGAENYWPWGPSIGDVNADGFDDIFITSSMNFPFRYGINSLLLNDAGKQFLDSEFVLGIEPRRDGRTATDWFDVDCSEGGLEPNNLLAGTPCEGRTGRIMITAPLGSRAAVIFDLDNDGDLDIVTNDFNSAPQVLVSNLAERKPIRWLKVLLVGTASNRDGLGATVRVRAGGRTYTKYHDGKSGYLSHSALPLYFGLGDAEKIESLEVIWPSGKAQTAKPIQVNQTLRIVETK
ncbi:MAG: CRTAC1 family protein [Candidatus Acidiferrales bacterium]